MRHATTIAIMLVLAATSTLVGCGGLSRQAREQIDYTGGFESLQADPDRHIGATALLGGRVIATTPSDSGTEIVALQLPLGSNDRPQDGDNSQGRFILRTPQFIDPALYPKDTLISVVAKLTGSEQRKIGEMDYRYPVLSIVEIKKWPPPDTTGPRIHFGIGVGKTF